MTFSPAGSNMPDVYHGIIRGAQDAMVQCTAVIEPDPKSTFAFDIGRKFKVLPVRLTISLLDPDAQVEVNDVILDPVLFLENGFTLQPLDWQEARRKVPKKYQAAFKQQKLENLVLFGGARRQVSGYVLFELPGPYAGKDDMINAAGASDTSYRAAVARSIVQLNYKWSKDGRSGVAALNVGVD